MPRSKRLPVSLSFRTYATGKLFTSYRGNSFWHFPQSLLVLVNRIRKIPMGRLLAQFAKDRILISDLLDFFVWLDSVALHYNKFHQFPNVVKPTTLNDHVNRYKLTIKHPLSIELSDKIKGAEFVRCAKSDVFVLQQVEINGWQEIPDGNWIIKTSHDSGGVSSEITQSHYERLEKRLGNVWGIRSGEIVYWRPQPRIFLEELLPEGENFTDVKVFCYQGVPFGILIIGKENGVAKELVLDRTLNPLTNILNDRPVLKSVEIDFTAEEINGICKKLCSEFEFVRLDLLRVSGNFHFGEFTFFPMAGCHSGGAIFELGLEWSRLQVNQEKRGE